MWRELLSTAISCLLSAVITGLLTYLVTSVKAEKKRKASTDQKITNIATGTMHLLKSNLKESHEYFVNRQHWCSIEDKEEVETCYQTYHALGGNGRGTKLRDEIMALPSYPK